MTRILVAGATSAIAEATARCFAEADAAAGRPAAFVLAARNAARLEMVAADLRARGAATHVFVIDFDDLDAHAALLDAAREELGAIDLVLVAWGILPDQARVESDPAYLAATWHTNASATVGFIERAAGRLEAQGAGALAVITSVAGDRGRRDNYAYGAAKAAVDTYLEGLRARLHARGIAVTTIKPGRVDTPMIAHLPPSPINVSAATAGKRIHRAILRRRSTVYVPGFWRYIMRAIRLLPEALMIRLSFGDRPSTTDTDHHRLERPT